MKRTMMTLALVLASCAGVTRDGDVYKREVEFVGRVTAQLSAQQLAQAREAADRDEQVVCAQLAEPALVGAILVPYNLSMSLAAAGLGDDPGAIPLVPTATAWCGGGAR